MPLTSVTCVNSKTAEFARLFDLFDRVATRRTRALNENTSEDISTEDIAGVPAEFAPLLKNLSTILSSRTRRAKEYTQRTRAVSIANPCHEISRGAPTPTESPTPHVDTTEPPDQIEPDADRPAFPLVTERYPFTFKLMLHKLYDLQEWADKVKNAVETSKSQFKPLAEWVQNVDRDATTSVGGREKRDSVIPFLGATAKFRPPSKPRRSHPATTTSGNSVASPKERGERRSNLRPILGASAKFKPPSTTRHPQPTSMSPTKPEASRVVKKRCIGRRKSISGPMSTGVWVYDAAISATEVAGPRPAVEITLSAPRGTSVTESRVRHQSLTSVEGMQARETWRRKVKITVPLLPEEGAELVLARPSSVSQEVMGTERLKRRSLASTLASESCKRVASKRPLCV